MGWLRILTIIFVAVACRSSHGLGLWGDTHIPGSIKSWEGHILVAQDLLVVKLDMTKLSIIHDKLILARSKLVEILGKVDLSTLGTSKELLSNMKLELDKLVPYTGRRSKRSLFPFMGKVSKFLWGSATDKDLKKVDNKVDELIRWASREGKLITKIVGRINSDEQRVHSINLALQGIVERINNGTERWAQLYKGEFTLEVVEKINILVRNYQVLTNALTIARKGVVSPNLLSPSILVEVLQEGVSEFSFDLIYPIEHTELYYHLLQCQIVNNHVFVFIPFRSKLVIDLFEVTPFPSFTNGSLIVQSGLPKTLVMITHDYQKIVITSKIFLDTACIQVDMKTYLCPASKLVFQPASTQSCVVNIIANNKMNKECVLERVNITTPVIKQVDNFNYIFLPSKSPVTITCPNEQARLMHTEGNLKVKTSCGVSIPDTLHIFQSSIYEKTMEMDVRVYDFFEDFALPDFSSLVNPLRYVAPPTREPLEEDPWTPLEPRFQNNMSFWTSHLTLPALMFILVGALALVIKFKIFNRTKMMATTIASLNNAITQAVNPVGAGGSY